MKEDAIEFYLEQLVKDIGKRIVVSHWTGHYIPRNHALYW